MLAVMIGQPLGAVPASAQETGTLSGTVLDPAAAPVSGATVTITGPATATTKTDAEGRYSLSAPQGIYRILVHAGGFSDSTDDAVTLTTGGVTLDVRMTRPTLSSLQTIGTVRSTGGGAGGPQFNTTAASQSTIGAPTFENQGDVGVRNILDETPGIVDSSSNGSANGGVADRRSSGIGRKVRRLRHDLPQPVHVPNDRSAEGAGLDAQPDHAFGQRYRQLPDVGSHVNPNRERRVRR
jgi:hypothetical protein